MSANSPTAVARGRALPRLRCATKYNCSTLSGATTATPSFTPDVSGTYTAQLTVSDGQGGTDSLSNIENASIRVGKAGKTRWRGVRPTVRGLAMNPVDHPHGGGEGRTSGGRHPVTPWGKPTKGARTRNNKQTDKMIIRSRHAKKKR